MSWEQRRVAIGNQIVGCSVQTLRMSTTVKRRILRTTLFCAARAGKFQLMEPEKKVQEEKYVLPVSDDFPIITIALTEVFRDLYRDLLSDKAVAFIACCRTAMVVSAETRLFDKRIQLNTTFLHSPCINQGLRDCVSTEDIKDDQIKHLRVLLHAAPILETKVVVSEDCTMSTSLAIKSNRMLTGGFCGAPSLNGTHYPTREIHLCATRITRVRIRGYVPVIPNFFEPSSPVHVLLDTHCRFRHL